MKQLREILHDDVGSLLAQRLSLTDSVDADDEPESACAAGGDASERILEHGRLARLDLESLRGSEERVRRRLSLQMLLRRDDPVDPDLEEIRDPGRLKHVARVRARGDDSAAESGVAHRSHIAHRTV